MNIKQIKLTVTAAHARHPGVQEVTPHIVPFDFPPGRRVALCESAVRPQRTTQRIYCENHSGNNIL